jgi:hypothetical protein
VIDNTGIDFTGLPDLSNHEITIDYGLPCTFHLVPDKGRERTDLMASVTFLATYIILHGPIFRTRPYQTRPGDGHDEDWFFRIHQDPHYVALKFGVPVTWDLEVATDRVLDWVSEEREHVRDAFGDGYFDETDLMVLDGIEWVARSLLGTNPECHSGWVLMFMSRLKERVGEDAMSGWLGVSFVNDIEEPDWGFCIDRYQLALITLVQRRFAESYCEELCDE